MQSKKKTKSGNIAAHNSNQLTLKIVRPWGQKHLEVLADWIIKNSLEEAKTHAATTKSR